MSELAVSVAGTGGRLSAWTCISGGARHVDGAVFSNIFWLICCGRVPQLRGGINVFPATSLLTSFERLGADRWISDGMNGSEKCIDVFIC